VGCPPTSPATIIVGTASDVVVWNNVPELTYLNPQRGVVARIIPVEARGAYPTAPSVSAAESAGCVCQRRNIYE